MSVLNVAWSLRHFHAGWVDSLFFTSFRAHVHPMDVYQWFVDAKGVMDLSPVP